MKHDYRSDSDSEQAQAFLSWLESETTAALARDHGNLETVRSSVFLFVNRAYEAGLPDALIGRMFGGCLAKAGFSEQDQDPVFDLLEFYAETAKQVHSGA